jgi:predicted Zn-dependent protease
MNPAVRVAAVLAVSLLVACTVPRAARQPAAPGPAVAGSSLAPPQLLAAVQHDADLLDQTRDAAARKQLLAAAASSAAQCLSQSPNNAACPYAQAQVLGLQARERPLEGISLLKDMLASLSRAEALDPSLDHAGPARLTAIVLLRAPPWPLGPGDVDAAITAAQRAVKRDPTYPPNLITLGEAQSKLGASGDARSNFARAQVAVQDWASTAQSPDEVAADRARWQQQVQQDLHDLQ